MKNKQSIALITTVIYIAIMGIGMTVMHKVFQYSYAQPEMSKVIIFFEVIMTALVFIVGHKFFGLRNIGFGKMKPLGLIFLAPLFFIEIVMIIPVLKNLGGATSNQLFLILVILGTTLLVGTSEEVMFRGILLHSFSHKGQIVLGIIISTLCFSLLHAVNILGGSPVNAVSSQLVSSLFMGLAMAGITVYLRNIIPLIIFHFLWDFILISGQILTVPADYTSVLEVAYNFLLGITLFIIIIVKRKSINEKLRLN